MLHTSKGVLIDRVRRSWNKQTAVCRSVSTITLDLKIPGGDMSEPLVKVGQRVKKGEMIASAVGEFGCNIFSGVSGTVLSVSDTVVIESDGKNEVSENAKPVAKRVTELVPDEILKIIRDAGIVDLHGSGKPLAKRLMARMLTADNLIISCVEPDAYRCNAERIIKENPSALVEGAKILMLALGVKHTTFVIGSDRNDAYWKLRSAIRRSLRMFSIENVLPTHPSDDPAVLLKLLYHVNPAASARSKAEKYFVIDADTVEAVYRAFYLGMPLCEKRVSVGGDCIKDAKCVFLPIGAPVSEAIYACGGLNSVPGTLVFSNILSGRIINDPDEPIPRTEYAIFADPPAAISNSMENCIRCGDCIRVCPLKQNPYLLVQKAKDALIPDADCVKSCIECGACTYVCPSNIPIAKMIRLAKSGGEGK